MECTRVRTRVPRTTRGTARAREAREETGQTGGEARDRPAGGATRRVTSLRLRAPRRAAPPVRLAPVRCLAGSAP